MLSACASGPDYRPPGAVSMGVPDRFFGAGVAGASAGELPLWWRRLNDLLLDVLIADATVGNLDLSQSRARLRQARESLVQARSARYPSCELSPAHLGSH